MENKSRKYPCEVSMISCLLLRAWKGDWAAGGAEDQGGLVDSLRVSDPPEADYLTPAHLSLTLTCSCFPGSLPDPAAVSGA